MSVDNSERRTDVSSEYHKEKKHFEPSPKSTPSSSEQVNTSSTGSQTSDAGLASHLSGPYRLADPVHQPRSDPRRLQADAFYGMQSLNVSENTLSSTNRAHKCDRGTQTDDEADANRVDPKDNPLRDHFVGLLLVFTIHSMTAIATGITLNLTSWGAIIGVALGFLTFVPILWNFGHDIYGVAKHLESTMAKWQISRSSQLANSGRSSPAEALQSSTGRIEPSATEMVVLPEVPRGQRQDSYTMHGALFPVLEEPKRSIATSYARLGAQVGPKNDGRTGTEGHPPLSDTRLSRIAAVGSSEERPDTNRHSRGNTLDISPSHFDQGDPGRESPDLYGATPPRTGTPESIVEPTSATIVHWQSAPQPATSEHNDRKDDGRLYSPRHKDTEGDLAIPELRTDTASTTSLSRSAPVLKRQWTK